MRWRGLKIIKPPSDRWLEEGGNKAVQTLITLCHSTTAKVTTSKNLAGEEGFEPSLHGPEPGVLPLDYSPANCIKVLQSVSNCLIPYYRPFTTYYLPSTTYHLLPTTYHLTKKIGQKTLDFLPNPPRYAPNKQLGADYRQPYYNRAKEVMR